MQFQSALAHHADPEAACRSVAAQVRAALGEGPLDLLVAFASPRYGANLDRVPVWLHELLAPRQLIGCSGGALVTERDGCAGRPAVAVLAGRLPGAALAAAHWAHGDLPSADAAPAAWQRLLPDLGAAPKGMVVLCEPFHCDARAVLAGLDYAWPGAPKVGGLASGSRHPDGHALFLGRSTHRSGALVLALAGDVELAPVVAQGCRPIGRAGRVTRAERNRLVAVDDAPARQFVERQLESLSAEDLELAEQSPLFLGIGSDPFASAPPRRGDFLVRNILGIDPESGTVVVGDHLAAGRHVQLHLRCAQSSELDLRECLQRAAPARAQAGLLFRCLGRDGDDHRQFAALAPGVPLAGFHCNGEIGPVGANTHLHGYTAAFALLRRPEAGR